MTVAVLPADEIVFAAAGPLSFATVADIAKRIAAIPPRATVTVDLAGTGAADSSALALFIEIGRHVREGGGRIEFRNVPEAIRRIGAVYGLEDLFGPKGPERSI